MSLRAHGYAKRSSTFRRLLEFLNGRQWAGRFLPCSNTLVRSPNFLDTIPVPISWIRFDSIRLHFRLPNYLKFIFSGDDGGSILDHALDFLTRGVCWPCCCLCTVEQLKARRLKHDNVTGSLLRLLHSSLRVSQVTCPATTHFQNRWPLKQDTLCVVILLLLL